MDWIENLAVVAYIFVIVFGVIYTILHEQPYSVVCFPLGVGSSNFRFSLRTRPSSFLMILRRSSRSESLFSAAHPAILSATATIASAVKRPLSA